MLKLIALITVLVLGYNYWFGDRRERDQSAEVVAQISQAGIALADLARSEKQRLDAGKYDALVSNLQSSLQALSPPTSAGHKSESTDLPVLQDRVGGVRARLTALREKPDTASNYDERGRLVRDIEDLAREIDQRYSHTSR